MIDGAPRVFVVNVRRILEGDDEDVPLEAGDVVLVPERISERRSSRRRNVGLRGVAWET